MRKFNRFALATLAGAALWAQAPPRNLEIAGAAVHQFEDGPPLGAGESFLPGETVFYSFLVHNFGVAPGGRVRFNYRIDVRDAEGVALVEPAKGTVAIELGPEDKEWVPKVRHEFLIPPHALAGRYRILAEVNDAVTFQQARSEVLFSVRGKELDTSGPLSIKNVAFFRGEEGRNPAVTATYRAGDTLWVRFDITGFKSAENNRMHVVYGLAILNPAGKILFERPEAASETDAPFYPRRYVSAEISLDIQRGTPPGEYTLVLAARDEVGAASCESRHSFRIEP